MIISRPLMSEIKIDITPTSPFNFDATLHKPDHFPSSDNEWQPGIRWQTMRWQSRALGLKFENQGTIDQPKIQLSIWSDEVLDQGFLDLLVTEINYRYNFHVDLTDFYRRFQDDPNLGPVLTHWRGMRPLNYSSLYEYLIISIVLQNATVRRSVQMMQALLEHYGTPLSYDGKKLYCIWPPEVIHQATEQELRDLKVGYRVKSIKRVTESFVNKEIDEFELRKQSQEEQRQALLNLYGIGPASVWYIVSDVFHRLDELNYISPWEQRIYSKLFFERDPNNPVPVDDLLTYLKERFGEYRMLAVQFFWVDLFWKRKYEPVEWLEKLIRL
jgi:3-methyladenine DNA glycosylase/8-oxoguanine DNA glycosylase